MTPLARKAFAEALGSALLACTVVGSGIAAQRLSPDDDGLQLLENSLITGAVLVALVLALGPVSAAFNPTVTLAERALGAITTRVAAVFVAAQVSGCCLGVMVANLMVDLPAVDVSRHDRTGGELWLGEVVATFGLLVVVFGVVRSGRGGHVAGIAPGSVPLFALMQLVGAALAVGAVLALYPDVHGIGDDIAHPDHPDRTRQEARP